MERLLVRDRVVMKTTTSPALINGKHVNMIDAIAAFIWSQK
jgi:hypothetical protein